MQETNIKELKIRLELLQEKVWTNEDKIKTHLESILEQETELMRLRKLVEILQHEFSILEKDIVQLKEKGGKK